LKNGGIKVPTLYLWSETKNDEKYAYIYRFLRHNVSINPNVIGHCK